MRKALRIVMGLAIALVLTGSLSSCGYNSMVNKEEAVSAQWSQVENVYQRRLDLIPNLVATVKGAANFEKSTLVAVTEARAKATQSIVNVDPSKLTPENIKQFQQAQDQLGGALSRLLVSVEKYPDLKANQNFLALQDQLDRTENRITVERQKYNQVVQEYNSYIRRFPNNLTANMFGFDKKGYFTAKPGAEDAPKVDFGE